MVRDTSKKNTAAPNLVLPIVLVEEKRTAASRPAISMNGTLKAPVPLMLAIPPPPSDWVDARRQLTLELRAGERIILKE